MPNKQSLKTNRWVGSRPQRSYCKDNDLQLRSHRPANKKIGKNSGFYSRTPIKILSTVAMSLTTRTLNTSWSYLFHKRSRAGNKPHQKLC